MAGNELELARDNDDAMPVFPFYLLVDVSWSMKDELGDLNTMLQEFRDRLRADPVTHDTILFSVLSFGSTARVEVPLGNFDAVELPENLLKIDGSTCYSAAFRLLKDTIEQDIAALKRKDKAAGSGRDTYRYYRPAVFFLTDGDPDPGDPWRQAFAELKSIKAYPLFVPFGFRQATDVVLRELIHPPNRSKLYFTRSSNVTGIMSEMLDVMFQSIISSALSATGSPKHLLPTQKDVGREVKVQQYGDDGDFV